jgi:uncharacterized protein HemX
MSDPTTDRDLPEDHEPTARLEPEQATEPPTPVPSAPDEPREGGRHPLQVGYLVAGLLALGFALVWLLSETGVVDQPAGDGVGVSLVLIAAGLAGLLASLGRSLRRSR